MQWLTRWTSAGRARERAAGRHDAWVMKTALDPVLFERFGLPDQFEARAQMVSLLTAILAVRIAKTGATDARTRIERLNQRILDGFDAAFREKGVGDHSIARKVRGLAAHHTGLGKAVFAALLKEPCDFMDLQSILERNGVSKTGEDGLAKHLLALRDGLDSIPDAAVLVGNLDRAAPVRA